MTKEKLLKQMIGKTFIEISDAIKTGQFGEKIKIGLTTYGSEHGVENLVKGAELASQSVGNFEVLLIGPKVNTELEVIEVAEEDMYREVEKLLDTKYISACVTMDYSFPVGVSTVGKVITSTYGKEMYLATTTGTSSTHRVEAMVKNALHGIIVAKAMGNVEPTVGVLNVDGARQVERALKELNANGYKIRFAESVRASSGIIMRGNDLLKGTADVMITDTLTGNILMKFFSSYMTGGNCETIGYGYGPGVGENYNRTILILSRASGVPVVANAIQYAVQLSQSKLTEVAKEEFKKAKEANLDEILKAIRENKKKFKIEKQVFVPPKEAVTGAISGIDMMDLDDAVKVLWTEGIYAESGMGCTGPIILIHEEKIDRAMQILKQADFIR